MCGVELLKFVSCALSILNLFRQNASVSGGFDPQTSDRGSALAPMGDSRPSAPLASARTPWRGLWQPGAATDAFILSVYSKLTL